jgi:hypothetical protein
MFTKFVQGMLVLGLVLSAKSAQAAGQKKSLVCTLNPGGTVRNELSAQFSAPVDEYVSGGKTTLLLRHWEGAAYLSYGYVRTFKSGSAQYVCQHKSIENGSGQIECRGYTGMGSFMTKPTELVIEAVAYTIRVKTNDPEVGLIDVACVIALDPQP